MRFYFILFFLQVFCFQTIANDSLYVDSLQRVLVDANEKDKIKIYSKIAEGFYNQRKFDSTLSSINKALVLLEKHPNKKIKIYAITIKVYVYNQRRQYGKAYNLANEALKMSKASNDSLTIARMNYEIAAIYYQRGDLASSLERIVRSLTIFQKLDDHYSISLVSNFLAGLYVEINNYDEALKYFHISLSESQKIGDKINEGYALNNIGDLCMRLKDYDKALKYYQKSLTTLKNANLKGDIALVKLNIAEIYELKHTYDKALELYREALNLSILGENKPYEAIICSYMARCFNSKRTRLKTDNYKGYPFEIDSDYKKAIKKDSVLKYLDKSLKLVKEIEDRVTERDIYKISSDLLENFGFYKKSLKYFKEYNQIKDTLLTLRIAEKIGKVEINYKVLEKEKEIKLLAQKNKMKKEVIEQQEFFIVIIVIFSFIFLVLGVFYVRQYMSKRNINKELTGKNIDLQLINSKLTKSEEKLSKLNQTKDQMFSIIAHDLKNPFSSMIGFTEILAENFYNLTEEEVLQYSQHINISSKNLYNLLENLLSWARSQTNGLKYYPNENKLYPTIETTIELLLFNAQKKNITLHNMINEEHKAFFDSDLITTVVRNLLSNAIKFTPRNGHIEILSEKVDNELVISVKDSGLGIEEKDLNKIFSLSKHFSTLGTDDEKGTGLGLILCKELVEMNKGEIWIESEKHKGSTFYFSLPLS